MTKDHRLGGSNSSIFTILWSGGQKSEMEVSVIRLDSPDASRVAVSMAILSPSSCTAILCVSLS